MKQEDFWTQDMSRLQQQIAKKNRLANASHAKKLCFGLIVVFVFICCFYLSWLFFATKANADTQYIYITGDDLQQQEQTIINQVDQLDDDVMVVLAVGCDKREHDIGRSDTIMLAFVDKKNSKVSVISLPRDSYVTIPRGKGTTKLNHAYAYGGISLLEETIENTLDVQIDNYVEVDFNGFAAIIDDALGGITIDVEKDMYNPLEHIDLKAGTQKLKGKDALGYVRFRDNVTADIGRIERQQKFLMALAEQTFKLNNVVKIPKLVNIVSKYIKTDLTTSELISLGALAGKIDLSAVEMHTLPGKGQYVKGVSYWMIDSNKKDEIIDYCLGKDTIPAVDASSTVDN